MNKDGTQKHGGRTTMICDWCHKEMNEVDTCTGNLVVEFPDGTTLPSLTFHFDEDNGRCHDCKIKHGG
jgi:hypothetical protein